MNQKISLLHTGVAGERMINKLMSGLRARLCPVIDHKLHQNIAKVDLDSLRGFTDYFDNAVTKFMINNRTVA